MTLHAHLARRLALTHRRSTTMRTIAALAAATILAVGLTSPAGATVPRNTHGQRHLPTTTYTVTVDCVRGDLPVGGKWRGWQCA